MAGAKVVAEGARWIDVVVVGAGGSPLPKAASLFGVEQVRDLDAMMDAIFGLVNQKQKGVRKLAIYGHGWRDHLMIGGTFIGLTTLHIFRSTIRQLRQVFIPEESFVELHACHTGHDEKLLREIAALLSRPNNNISVRASFNSQKIASSIEDEELDGGVITVTGDGQVTRDRDLSADFWDFMGDVPIHVIEFYQAARYSTDFVA